MQYDKIVILAIFLVSLLAIGTVSAEDNITFDIVGAVSSTNTNMVEDEFNSDFNSSNLILTLNDDENLNTIENDNELLTDSPKTFSQLNNLIQQSSGSEINLEFDYVYNSIDDKNLSEGITIDKQITINGNGHTINGNKESRIFYVTSTNVALNNITFINSKHFDGGAIYWFWSSSRGSVVNCSFVNNSADDYGGAIYWDASGGSVVNCSFVNNSAPVGGAVSWSYSVGSVVNCSFVGNSANSGGAVVWSGSDGSVVNCSFVGNSANDDNSAGGAVLWEGYCGSVVDCSFVNNSAHYGGAILCQLYDDYGVSVVNCSFVNNSASIFGGAVFWLRSGGSVVGCSFVGNSASMGGVLYWPSSGGSVVNCSFVNNSADDYGGAIYWEGSECSVVGCSFVGNSAPMGGAVLCEGYDNTVVGCSFVNNSVDDYGGAVYWQAADGSVDNCSFVGNSAPMGGAVYWQADEGSVVGCSFVGNSASDAGGAVYWQAADGSVVNCSFLNNSAYEYGGAFYILGDSSTRSCSFINNHAIEGGAIYIGSNILDSSVIYDSIFINNNENATVVCLGKNITAVNSWFGNNATNYNIKPVAGNVILNNWLFLNATCNRNTFSVIETSNVTFKLYAYDSNNGNVSDYDNGLLQPIELTLTTTNGDIDRNIVGLSQNVKYAPNRSGKGSITAALENVGYTIEFDVEKANSTLTANNLSIFYSSSVKLAATLKDEKGNAIPDVKVNVVVGDIARSIWSKANGEVYLDISSLSPGNYTASFTFAGNKNYMGSSAMANVIVNDKIDTNISLVYDADAGELVGTLTNAEGKALVTANVVVSIDGVNYALKTNSKGQAKVSTANLTAGSHVAFASYKGNTKYNPSNVSVVINNKLGTVVSLVYDADANEVVGTLTNAEGKALVTANLVVSLNGVDYALKTNSKGQVKVSTANLTYGIYTAYVSYKGNSKYNPSSASVVVNTKLGTVVSLVYDADAGVLVGTLTNAGGKALVTANVIVNFDGVDYALKTNSRGQVKVSVGNLTHGIYQASISYKGNSKYNPSNESVIINTKLNPCITLDYDDGAKELVGTLTNAEGKALVTVNLIVTIDGVDHALKTNSKGQVKLSTADFPSGNYIASVSYKGNSKYNPTSATETIIVE